MRYKKQITTFVKIFFYVAQMTKTDIIFAKCFRRKITGLAEESGAFFKEYNQIIEIRR